jgi:hypothetical protein
VVAEAVVLWSAVVVVVDMEVSQVLGGLGRLGLGAEEGVCSAGRGVAVVVVVVEVGVVGMETAAVVVVVVVVVVEVVVVAV